MKSLKIALLFLIPTVVFGQQPYLIVGTYTNGKSQGIYTYKFNSKTADAKLASVTKSSNPSYLAVAPNKKMIYAVNENADSVLNGVGGTVTAYTFKTGQLKEINKMPSGGAHPCYVAIDKTSKYIFTGNYTSGTIGVLKLKKDGRLDTLTQVIQHNGRGPNTDRQQSPHVHATYITADNKFLLVPDLGTDKMMLYQFNAANGKLARGVADAAVAQPGSGPRHVDVYPNGKFVYLVLELTGEVLAFKNLGSFKLEEIQNISAQPPYIRSGNISSADIHVSPDGNFLYCSNRGNANTIAIFSIDKLTGMLTPVGQQPTQGIKPRNFNFSPDGNFLLVANQETSNIVIFKVDKKTGLLTDTNKRIEVPNPVCLKWVE
jgi:6-phosphogluconolactonase